MKYRIAIATTDGIHIDEHFGKAKVFYIYELSENINSHAVADVRSVKTDEEQEKENGGGCEESCHRGACSGKNMEFVSYIADCVQDCNILLAKKIGIHAQYFLQRRGIASFEIELGVEDAIQKLNAYLKKRGLPV